MTSHQPVRNPTRRSPLFILLFLLSILLAADLLLVFLLLRSSPDPVSDELKSKLSVLRREDSDYEPLAEHPENYPAELIELAANNPEALEFVLNYPELHDAPPADSIEELEAGKIPYLLQWDKRWGYAKYGDHCIAVSGCGPTCLSMVLTYLSGDNTLTPAVLAQFSQKNGHYVSGSGSSWSLMTDAADEYGVTCEELPLDEHVIKSRLDESQPVICVLGPGDFTDSGHFIVLSGYEEDGFQVLDPNSRSLSEQLWSYEKLSPLIRNLWAFFI